MKSILQKSHFIMLFIILVFAVSAYISTQFDSHSTEWVLARTIAYGSVLLAGIISLLKPELLFQRRRFKNRKAERQYYLFNRILGGIWLLLAVQAIYEMWR
ncbi:MAG: hypothetical protein FH756_12375 [Firmicutes bacterium]|nr:hypothetical protein [Bacillota bacterium]